VNENEHKWTQMNINEPAREMNLNEHKWTWTGLKREGGPKAGGQEWRNERNEQNEQKMNKEQNEQNEQKK
jgi:hypothetical protein